MLVFPVSFSPAVPSTYFAAFGCHEKVFRHNMLSVLETAIRSSLAQEEEESIIARLDVRLLEGLCGNERVWE